MWGVFTFHASLFHFVPHIDLEPILKMLDVDSQETLEGEKMNVSSYIEKILSNNGIIAQHLRGYEYRPQQLLMAEAISNAIEFENNLIVEAGTGVGKSFAYLIPAIFLSIKENELVVVSTNTISLQEQLIHKDIPFLQEVMPFGFKAVLVKGRSNYLCKRRLRRLLVSDRPTFDTREEVEELQRIEEWARKTSDGSKSDIEPFPMSSVWEKVSANRDYCMRELCPFYNECFYYNARREMEKANLLVVNHHLLFSDLEVRTRSNTSVLPEYDYLIIDEAQHIENIATEHTGVNLSNYRVKRLLDLLYYKKDGESRGLFPKYERGQFGISLVEATRERADEFFDNVLSWLKKKNRSSYSKITQRIDEKRFVRNNLEFSLNQIEEFLEEMSEVAGDDEEEMEIKAYVRQCKNLREDLDMILKQTESDYVYWIEFIDRRYMPILMLNATPISVAEHLHENLFNKTSSVIMTSATLSTNRNFYYFKERSGATGAKELILGSPFNYKEQTTLYIPAKMPDPRNKQFIEIAAEKILKYISHTQGKAFVLFTSYRMMDEIYEIVEPELDYLGINSFKQGGGMSRHAMLREFRYDVDSVLFGTSSFWEGVDVQGEALSNVIIVKLPFSVPTHPVVKARMEAVEENGGNAFMDYSLPEAILRLKQGFGRLIRNKNDKGIIVILDTRIITKPYGKMFLNSLPDCDVVID